MEENESKRLRNTEETSDEDLPAPYVPSASSEALSNHLVLKQIFVHLDVKNLLRLSLVSKVWCSTARSILRSSRRCLATMEGAFPCQELLQLNEVLANSEDHPFSGLAIRTCRNPKKQEWDQRIFSAGGDYAQDYCSSTEEEEGSDAASLDGSYLPESEDSEVVSEEDDFTSFEESSSSVEENPAGQNAGWQLKHVCVKGKVSENYAAILEKLSYRHFEIHWDMQSGCPSQALLVKILKQKREVLKELKITRYPYSASILRKFLGIKCKDWLPNLQVLDLSGCVPTIDNTVKCDLIEGSPKLQKQLGLNRLHDLAYFLNHGKVSVMRHYDFFYPSRQLDASPGSEDQALMRFATAGPKLTKLLFTGFFLHDLSANATLQFIQGFLRTLLESVSDSLEEVQFDQTHFILFFILNPPPHPLTKLKKLTLALSKNLDRRLEFPTLEKFNWDRWFPCLETVSFCLSPHDEDYLIMGKLQEQRPSYSCLSVTKLIFTQKFDPIEYSTYTFEKLHYLSNLFPNIKDFSLVRAGRIDKVLQFLWSSWPNIETITMTSVKISALTHNLDPIFCGISKEDCATYRAMTIEDLKKVELSPTQPSIVSLTKLKKIRLEVLHRQRCHRKRTKASENFFLTHVTPTLAFSRIPGLVVEVVREMCKGQSLPCGYSFEHLASHVNLTNADDKK